MLIHINGLCKRIKTHTVLKDISLSFRSGEIYGIVGSNGSGKTMLLRAIVGLIIPTKGTVSIDGQILHEDIEFPSSVGVLIEKPVFLDYLTGFENLKILAEIKKKVPEKRIAELMTEYALNPNSTQKVKQYSLGMKQKLGIIQAIMEYPDLLILDEPTNALDEQSILKFRKFLLEYKNENRIIILTSHNAEDINSLCTKIYHIDDGRII